MVSFLDQNRGFVLKLKITTADGQSQIRRVPLHRIVDAKGDISYEELVNLVLVFSQTGYTKFRDAKRYIITLTYYDDEKDLITLASTEELKEAIELFAGQKFLRITTCVKTKTLSTTPTFTSSYRRSTAVSPPTATGSSESGLKVPPNFANLRNEKVLNVKIVGRNNKGKERKVLNGIKLDQVKTNTPPCKNNIPHTSNNTPTGKNITETLTNTNESNSNRYSCKTKESEETNVDVPFIHGRHTCDGCLTTPIIGERYHSTNLKDYDLCQQCYDNYKGSAIKYEAVELRRDIAFQNRWRQRHQKAVQMRKLYQSRRDPPQPYVPPRTQEQNHTNSKSHRVSLPKQSVRQDNQTSSKVYHGNSSSTRPISHSTNPAAQNNIPNSNNFDVNFDDQLKEAIRRSLDDAVSNKDLNKTSNEMVEVKEDLPNHESLPDDILPQKNNDKTLNKNIAADNYPTDHKCLSHGNVPNENSTKTDESLEMNGDLPNELDEKKQYTENKSLRHDNCAIQDDIPSSIEIAKQQIAEFEMGDLPSKPNEVVEENGNSLNEESLVQEKDHEANDEVTDHKISGNGYLRSTIVDHKQASGELLTSGESASEELISQVELKDIETTQKIMDTDSVDSEKLVSESTGQDSLLTATENRSGDSHLKPRSPLHFQDTSFTSDAAGNGDVAEAMGKTLDMVAGVISEMLSESEGSDKPHKSDNKSKQGELILNSNDSVEKVDEEERDTDWSVVESIGSKETTESEQIGKATEMLGSALFNSDIRNAPEDNGSNMVSSDSSFSIPSSVPTDLGTVHSNAAGQNSDHRWVNELEKLRELGFDSDSICIEILERICSDSCTVETNIDRVVDELLSFNA
jgi:hypothetical protein